MNYKYLDEVIYIPENEKGHIIAVLGDLPFDNEYIFESCDKKHCCRAQERDLKLLMNPAEEFAKLDEDAKQFCLMQTMQRCQEVFAMLEAEGKIDSDIIGSIDWYNESEFKIELCREYENTYCGTEMYEENYFDSTEQFFRVKLLERFGKSKKKIFEAKIIGEHSCFIEANDIQDVYDFLYAHENDEKKDYLKTEFVAYDEEIKVSEYHGSSYNIAAVLEEGGEQ